MYLPEKDEPCVETAPARPGKHGADTCWRV